MRKSGTYKKEWLLGFQAYLDGKAGTQNPFNPIKQGPQHDAWQNGWNWNNHYIITISEENIMAIDPNEKASYKAEQPTPVTRGQGLNSHEEGPQEILVLRSLFDLLVTALENQKAIVDTILKQMEADNMENSKGKLNQILIALILNDSKQVLEDSPKE